MLKQNKSMKIILAVVLAAAILAGSAMIGGEVTLAGSGTIDRLGGADRYATSALIAGEKFDTSSYCIVTSGEVYADGLAASTLAGALNCPILLTRPSSLPTTVSNRIKSLGYPKVIILGGTSAVSTSVETALKDLVGNSKVERIGGTNRFDTAAKIARRADNEYYLPSYAYIVNGWASADSLVAGPAAFEDRVPILQVEKNSIPEVTKKAISDLGITRLYIVGGTDVVSNTVKTALEKLSSVYSVTRISGSTRYETSVEFAKSEFAGIGNFSIVGGIDNNLADAIGATVLGFPILYVERNSIRSAVNSYLNSEITSLSDIYVIGGTSAISDSVYNNIRDKITGEDSDIARFSKSSIYLDGTETNTLTISGTSFKNINYYEDDHYTISGLPSGVTHSLKRTGNYTAELTLNGYPALTSSRTVTVRILGAAVNSGKNLPSASFTLTKTAEEAAPPTVVGDLKLDKTYLEATATGQFEHTFKASGGKAPYEYRAHLAGSPGTGLNQLGLVLTGTGTDAGKLSSVSEGVKRPGGTGIYYFIIEIIDSGDVGKNEQKKEQFLIKFIVNPVPSVSGDDHPPGGTKGKSYSHTIKVTGGTAPYYFNLKTGDSLPPGLKLSTNGVLSGTPTSSTGKTSTQAETLTYKIQIMDTYGVGSGDIEITQNINPVPAFKTDRIDLGTLTWGVEMNKISIISNCETDRVGTAPYTFSVSGALPGGLKVANDDVGLPHIQGKPNKSGTFEFSVTINDRWNASATGKFKLTVQ